MNDVASRLFGPSDFYLSLIDEIQPRLSLYRYHFMPQEIFETWVKSANPAQCNQLIVQELLDNCHLAAVTALLRTRQWAKAMCSAYAEENFLAWAAAARGLIESSGDILEGLLNIPPFLAREHRMLAHALAGRRKDTLLGFAQVEEKLSHYIRAKWTRDKSIPAAKANVDYIRWIERAEVPGVVGLYHRLCGITHPSSASIEYLYFHDRQGLGLDVSRSRVSIEALLSEFPSVFPAALALPCNGTLLILRVMHRFDGYPRLPELKKLDRSQIKIGREIEAYLRR